MTATTTTPTTTTAPEESASARIHARRAGFRADLGRVDKRALRSIPRDPEAIVPALVVPLLSFAVNSSFLPSSPFCP